MNEDEYLNDHNNRKIRYRNASMNWMKKQIIEISNWIKNVIDALPFPATHVLSNTYTYTNRIASNFSDFQIENDKNQYKVQI